MLRKTLPLILLIALLSACAPQTTPTVAPVAPTVAATEAPVTAAPTEIPAKRYTDGLGREITLETTPQRIVSLAPSNTEILFAIGAGSQVVGRDEFSDYPAEAASIDSIGGSFGEYNAEAIVALEPDLVLAAEINTPELVKQLEDLGLTVFYLKNPVTLEEMYVNLDVVGQLTGHDVTDLIDSLEARVAAVDEKIAPISARPTVFYEIDATDASKPYSYGPGTFGDLLIQRAGGANLVTLAGITDAYPQVSLEQIVAANPSAIILGDSMWGVTPEAVLARAGWDALDAVKNNQIFPFDDNMVSRPGPRLVDGLEQLAKLLHPELFK
ncbi:MAG TPA: cobalamin-binding protein [Anaerolineales bacterium]|nr:cobalamin-binding protein [Anaerolineales bacterium]HNQ96194.1 cobalamin-binding protein [Anaerolineales bacterium]HNS59725.1 cobalamin-binding protein [Anaerolineales bacterium]